MSMVEYLYKYVYKNHGRVNVGINPYANPVNDEIRQFQVVVLGEDFHQVLPVVLHGSCRQTEAEYFKTYHLDVENGTEPADPSEIYPARSQRFEVIYPTTDTTPLLPELLMESAIFTALNDDVKKLNDLTMGMHHAATSDRIAYLILKAKEQEPTARSTSTLSTWQACLLMNSC
ncbi:hypothetical protein K7432_016348 [Basidiobolus ranarum]|uniref:DNA helicase n=1 Tax=Basidiobolus ranarum TaxID=34480 RepID=A0ABR2WEV6_9FUNG